MALNPPTTVTYESKADALATFTVLRFVRLPVPGPVERWACNTFAEDGSPIIIFASSAGRTDEGEVAYHFVEQAKA